MNLQEMNVNNIAQVQESNDELKFSDVISMCLKKWHWFAVCVPFCLALACLQILKTEPTYTRSAQLLVKDERSSRRYPTSQIGGFTDLSNLVSGSNVYNEMGVIQSPDLLREVVNRLRLDKSFAQKGRFRNSVLYGSTLPIDVEYLDADELSAVRIEFKLSADGSVVLRKGVLSTKADKEKLDNKYVAHLGDTLNTNIGRFVIKPSIYFDTIFAEGSKKDMEIVASRTTSLAALSSYKNKLQVTQNSKNDDIICLSFTDKSTKRADDIINTLISVYNEKWIMDKNQMAQSTNMFINDELQSIERELSNMDSSISDFKSHNRITDVQSVASLYLSESIQSNANLQELENQLYMSKFIRNYLTAESSMYQLLPANSGIGNNQGLNTQINEYNKALLDRNSLVAHSSTRNPLVKDLDEALKGMRVSLLNSIDHNIIALEESIKTQKGYNEAIESQISSAPHQAKHLLGIERQQKIKESLYLFLLQQRSQNELSQAFTAYNSRVITMPGGSSLPVAPKKMQILLIGLVLGFGLPFGLIYLLMATNTKVRGRKDLENVDVPFVGEIPLWLTERKHKFSFRKPEFVKKIVVKQGSRDVINEAFRVVRTNVEFMSSDKGSNVFVFTSFNPGSGKSFVSMNLANVLALKGKKVLVIDGDMRHASASAYYNSPSKGMSTYLSGNTDDIRSLIVNDSNLPCLSILPVGVVPPNPTELLESERFAKAIELLKPEYDYIFIDCPPIEIVADAHIVSKYADRTIFVLRAGVLERAMLSELRNLYVNKKFNNVSIILNGTDNSSITYKGRYGYKYGYKYGYGKGNYYVNS